MDCHKAVRSLRDQVLVQERNRAAKVRERIKRIFQSAKEAPLRGASRLTSGKRGLKNYWPLALHASRSFRKTDGVKAIEDHHVLKMESNSLIEQRFVVG